MCWKLLLLAMGEQCCVIFFNICCSSETELIAIQLTNSGRWRRRWLQSSLAHARAARGCCCARRCVTMRKRSRRRTCSERTNRAARGQGWSPRVEGRSLERVSARCWCAGGSGSGARTSSILALALYAARELHSAMDWRCPARRVPTRARATTK